MNLSIVLSVLEMYGWADLWQVQEKNTFITITVPSIDWNSTENHPDELIKNLTLTQKLDKYFDHVHFLVCNFILSSTSQNLILFNKYFKYLYVSHKTKCSTNIGMD